MQIVKQLALFLENKPGALSRPKIMLRKAGSTTGSAQLWCVPTLRTQRVSRARCKIGCTSNV